MRDPNSIITIDYVEKNNINLVKINNLPEFDQEDYDLFDEKDIKKYFADIEKEIRNSFEYKHMVDYLRNNLDMNKCSFYKNVNNIDSTKIKIHIHHEPITLFDIVTIIFNKRKSLRESLDIESIAKEAMWCHYSNLVGLIPLAETVHELVHNMYIFIPTDKVYGHYQQFVDMYREWIMPEQFDILDRIEEATRVYSSANAMNLLEKNYIYLDCTGAYELPSLETVAELMKQRLLEIKQNNKQLEDYKPQEDRIIIQPIRIVNKPFEN